MKNLLKSIILLLIIQICFHYGSCLKKKVIIIGSGVSGLAAGYSLKQKQILQYLKQEIESEAELTLFHMDVS